MTAVAQWVTAVAQRVTAVAQWVTAVAQWHKTPGIHCYVVGSIPAVTPRYSSNKARNALWSTKKKKKKIVPDKRIRNIPEVVLVRRWVSWGSGNLEGEGWVEGPRGGAREGQFTSNLRPRWTIPVTARRVPSK